MILCLLQFFQDLDWKDFRLAELKALLEMHGVDPAEAFLPSCGDSGGTPPPSSPLQELQEDRVKALTLRTPYLRLRLPSKEVAASMCARSVLIKHIYLLLGGASLGPSACMSVCCLTLYICTPARQCHCIALDSL